MYGERLQHTLPRVREGIAAAALRGGRDPAAVTLVAVTKGHPVAAVRAALAAGLSQLGESRVEELEEKAEAVEAGAARWHMIGHVQSRKAARAVAAADLIHSVDSLRLAGRVGRAALDAGRGAAAVLLQVNTSGEGSKGGFRWEEAADVLPEVAELEGLQVGGLMTMAPLTNDEAVLRASFSRLRELLAGLRRHRPEVGQELSMGMSNDVEIAVEEGSTMVRIGTALFGEPSEALT